VHSKATTTIAAPAKHINPHIHTAAACPCCCYCCWELRGCPGVVDKKSISSGVNVAAAEVHAAAAAG
jgi:hypothetical protein